MKLIEVEPKEGLTVRHPESGNPIRKGQKVVHSPAIRRLIKQGDLSIAESKPQTAVKPAAKKRAE